MMSLRNHGRINCVSGSDADAEPRWLRRGVTWRRTVGSVQNVGIRVGRTWPGGLIMRGRPCRGAAGGEYDDGRCEAKGLHDGVNSSNVTLTIWPTTNSSRYVAGLCRTQEAQSDPNRTAILLHNGHSNRQRTRLATCSP